MRGNTLAAVTNMLKAEIGHSLTAGAAQDLEFHYLIDDKQKWLTVQKHWAFLEVTSDVAASAGSRYLTLPTNLNFERPVEVQVKYNDTYLPVEFGIGAEEYNVWDSAANEQSNVIQRWKFYTGAANGFEVWPIPNVDQSVRFIGQKNLTSLQPVTAGVFDTTKTLDLDDALVVLFCAAELLARRGQKDAQLKAQNAQARLAYLAGLYPTRTQVTTMGGAGREEKIKQRAILVA